MPFEIACPKCSSRYSAPDQLRGQTVQCPSCSNSFVAGQPTVRASSGSAGRTATAVAHPPAKAAASATFVTSCTYCGQRFAAPASLQGQMTQCPSCNQSFKAMPLQNNAVQRPPAQPAAAANSGDWKWFEENFEPYKPPTVEKEVKRKPHVPIDKNLFEQKQPRRLRLASRLSRFAAAWIDGILIGGVAWFIFFASASSIPTSAPGEPITEQQRSELLTVLGIFFGWIGFMWVVNLILLAMRGQTVGKLCLGIKIVGSDGFPCFGRILGIRIIVMNFLKCIPFVGAFIAIADVLMIFRENRRCMHDELADTIVVRAR